MMKLFVSKKYFCILGISIVAAQVQGMEQQTLSRKLRHHARFFVPQQQASAAVEQQFDMLLQRYNETLINQAAYEQFYFDTKIDELVTKAKGLKKPRNGYTPIAIKYLEAAKQAGHPEAEFLTGDPEKAHIQGLQLYRFKKGIEDFQVLRDFQSQYDDKVIPLTSDNTVAYTQFLAIHNHPEHFIHKHDGTQELDDKLIRGQAEHLLFYMCISQLGVPDSEATVEKAHYYLQQACKHENKNALQILPTFMQMYGNQLKEASIIPAESAVTVTDKKSSDENKTQNQQQTQPVSAPANPATTQTLIIAATAQQPETEQSQSCPPSPKSGATSVESETQNGDSSPEIDEIPSQNSTQATAQPESELEHEAFQITEDTSPTISALTDGEPSARSHHIKRPAPVQKKQKLMLSRREKAESKKEKHHNEKSAAQKKEQAHVTSEAPKQMPVEKPTKPTKENKKDKASRVGTTAKQNRLDASNKQKNDEYKKAYALITNLISLFIDPTQAANLTAPLFISSENWAQDAKTFFTNSYNFYMHKEFKHIMDNHPDLHGIMLYLSCNKNQPGKLALAKKLLDENAKTGSGTDDNKDRVRVRNWYRALLLVETESDTQKRNQHVLGYIYDAVKAAFQDSLKIKESLFYSDALKEFVGSLAKKDNASEMDRVCPLLIQILCGPDSIEKATEDELIAEHNKGSHTASIYLASIYAYGVNTQQSFSKALQFLQQSVLADQQFDPWRSDVLAEISEIANTIGDQINYAHATYLFAIEQAKDISKKESIVRYVNAIEKTLKATNKSSRPAIAKLLESSGASKALIPVASRDIGIAKSLYNAALYRVHSCNHPKELYAEIFELARTLEIYDQNSLFGQTWITVSSILVHYFGENDTNKLKKEFSQTIDVTESNIDAYTKWYDFLAMHLKKENKPHASLLALLQYLQGNCPDGTSIANLMHDQKMCNLFSQWYNAILQFATQAASPERDNEILQKLSKCLSSVHVFDYKNAKDLLVFDERLFDFVVNIAFSSDDNNANHWMANTILGKIALFFGKEITDIDTDTAVSYLIEAHEHAYTDASICLAQMYAFGEYVPKSMWQAMKILQKMNDSNEGPCPDLMEFLGAIHKAKLKSPNVTLHARYLSIVQETKLKMKPEQIATELKNSIAQFNEVPVADRVQVANLLITSGAYNALLPLAKAHPEIAMLLCNAAAECIKSGASEKDFVEAFKLSIPTCADDSAHEKKNTENNLQNS